MSKAPHLPTKREQRANVPWEQWPEDDVDRTTADGKASAVHFVHFPFTDKQIAKFRDPSTRVTLGITHAAYGHLAILPDSVRDALTLDFD